MDKREYLISIEMAESMDDLEYILELAMQDEDLSNKDYCEIYGKAMDKAHEFSTFVRCAL